jgi:hypothetical protein
MRGSIAGVTNNADKVGIKVIRIVARSLPEATVGSLRQDRKGVGTDPGFAGASLPMPFALVSPLRHALNERVRKRSMSKRKTNRDKMKRAAAASSRPFRNVGASKWTYAKQERHNARKLGTFGAASPVRTIVKDGKPVE